MDLLSDRWTFHSPYFAVHLKKKIIISDIPVRADVLYMFFMSSSAWKCCTLIRGWGSLFPVWFSRRPSVHLWEKRLRVFSLGWARPSREKDVWLLRHKWAERDLFFSSYWTLSVYFMFNSSFSQQNSLWSVWMGPRVSEYCWGCLSTWWWIYG